MKKLIITAFLIFLPIYATAQQMHKGVVLQTFNVEGYTYMEIKDGNVTKWIASPTLDVKKGDVVETSYGMLMPDFESKTLKRTFKEIYFVTFARIVAPEKEAPKKTAIKEPVTKIKGKVYSVTELIEKKSNLAGTTVTFKAKVTKYSPAIMGKNWLHVTDLKDGKADLVVTTKDTAEQGKTVTIEGVLNLDKNLGSGYFFPIIIEEATVSPTK